MNKEEVKKILKELKESQKRKFNQTIDLIVVLRNIDLKKTDNHIDFYQLMHHGTGKDAKLCALVGPELASSAKENFDTVISVDDFPKFTKDKKALKKLAKESAFFVAQANIMPQVATSFGKILGPRGKMPNPKAGCVVPPNANMKSLAEKLKQTVRIVAKTMPMMQFMVGKEDSNEDDVADNILTLYDAILNHLPGGKNNISKVMLKLTMSKPIKLE